MKFNHMFDIAFGVDTDNKPDNVTIDELIEALEKRIITIKRERDIEAFGFCDSYSRPIAPNERSTA